MGNLDTVSDNAASSISKGRPLKRSSSLASHRSKAEGVMCEALGPSTSSSVLRHHTARQKTGQLCVGFMRFNSHSRAYRNNDLLTIYCPYSFSPCRGHELRSCNINTKLTKSNSFKNLESNLDKSYDGFNTYPSKMSWHTRHKHRHFGHKPHRASLKYPEQQYQAAHQDQDLRVTSTSY